MTAPKLTEAQVRALRNCHDHVGLLMCDEAPLDECRAAGLVVYDADHCYGAYLTPAGRAALEAYEKGGAK